MKRPAVSVSRLGIRRMPGFRKQGMDFSLESLSAGITVIHGPNGVGKTTTARALQSLLWPELSRDGQHSVEGALLYEGSEWQIDVDTGRVLCQRDGQDGHLSLPPAAVRDRYTLALHELLQADGKQFAQTIERESAGGISLTAARRSLKFGPVKPKRSKVSQDVAAAKRQLQEAQGVQRALAGDVAELADLEQLLASAMAAKGRADVLRLAREHRAAREELEHAEAAVKDLPDALQNVRPDDVQTVKLKQDECQALERELAGCDPELEELQARITACGLPPDGVPGQLTEDIAQRLSELKALDSRVQALRTSVAAAESRCASETVALGGVSPEDRGPIDPDMIEKLESLVARVAMARSEQEACQAVRDWLDVRDDGAELPDPAAVDEGLRLLARWLETAGGKGDVDRRSRAVGIVSGAVLVGTGLYACVSIHPAWGLLAVAGAGAIATVLWPRSRSAGNDELQRLYGDTGLPSPQRWAAHDVAALISVLTKQRAERQLERLKRERWDGQYAARAARADAQQRELAESKAGCLSDLGVDIDRGDGTTLWCVRALGRWQAADSDVQALSAELASLEAQRLDIRKAVQAKLAPYAEGDTNAPDTASLAAAFEDIRNRERDRAAALSERRHVEGKRDDIEKRLAARHEECAALYQRCGVAEGDLEALRDLCRQCGVYQSASQAAVKARTEEAVAVRRLRAHDAFEDDLLTLNRGAIERMLSEAQRAAGAIEDTNRRIIETRTRLQQARQSHDVADALARWEQAKEVLSDRREADYAAAVGDLLLRYVEERNVKGSRPKVFERARELLAAMTAGRYRLDMRDEDASFYAFDTVDNEGRPLEELSSGTRVQLLLAVRLAFVEVCETGAMLPLVADEVLANSDDPRGDAIIHAIITIARSGRQVFYFTAQSDEVTKWRQALSASGVEHAIVDLARARGLTAEAGERVPPVEHHAPAVPAPELRTHAAYGELLGIPAIVPAQGAAAIHPWYLVTDPPVLFRLLTAGISQWGQVEAYLDFGGGEALAEADLASARSLARAAEVMCDAWREGRGRPVDMAALVDSGAVTAAFEERLVAALSACEGNAVRLLEQVDDLPRFSSKNRERLEAYLEDEGYLDHRPVLERPDVRMRMMAAASADLDAGRVGPHDIERLLDGVTPPW